MRLCENLKARVLKSIITWPEMGQKTGQAQKGLSINHENYNFLHCDCFKKLLFSINSLAKLLSDSLLSDSLLLDSLLSESSVSRPHSKL